MKFWKFSTTALATLLSVVSASGPADGDAVADPNSAVVKLTTETFKDFLEENPLVLAEFFAPWCGYCKILAPEFTKAADQLNESHPNIKLAQIDCTEDQKLCEEHGIRGYPTMKIFRGETAEDYEGPREAAGIIETLVRASLPPVSSITDADEFDKLVESQTKPFFVQLNGGKADQEAFLEAAQAHRKDYLFVSVDDSSLNKAVGKKFTNVKIGKKPTWLLVHPNQFDDVRVYPGKSIDQADFTQFIKEETVPYFGEINRDTYLMYMTSPTPLAYYFYNDKSEVDAVREKFEALGKEYKGKVNFVALNAAEFGRHAEVINMDPEIIPLFAIQDSENNKKYGVDQQKHPKGPKFDVIEKFVEDFVAGKLTPIIKSEELPTDEERAANPVVKLVAHNHRDIVEDVSKDVFVKYYAPWCGHCKKLAPTWEELAEIYGSNQPEAEVIVADLDHTANDVDVPYEIEGYPTLLLYPANGEVDEKTGLRKPVVFEGNRELDDLIAFVKKEGANGVDVSAEKEKRDEEAAEILEDDEEEEEKPKKADKKAAKKADKKADKKKADKKAKKAKKAKKDDEEDHDEL
ncbi:protein disulfide-isomerase [Diutina catenulata]